MLLALTAPQGGQAGTCWTEAGLDHGAVRWPGRGCRALAGAGGRALGRRADAAIVLFPAANRGSAPRPSGCCRPWLRPAAGQKDRIEPRHVLVGLLNARVGGVPRALDLAGIDHER
jgi:hypothetical protein